MRTYGEFTQDGRTIRCTSAWDNDASGKRIIIARRFFDSAWFLQGQYRLSPAFKEMVDNLNQQPTLTTPKLPTLIRIRSGKSYDIQW